jgi:hypothetical protein
VKLGIHARYQGTRFRRFQIATLRVDSVVGEFYWRVEAGEQVRSTDYIAPPAMLSLEEDRNEQTWSLSSYLAPHEVERAFGAAMRLPQPIGVAPNQPYPGGVGRVALLALAVFCALGVGKCASAPDDHKLIQDFSVPSQSMLPRSSVDPTLGVVPSAGAGGAAESGDATAEPPGAVLFSDKFELDGGHNVAFDLSTNIADNWLYVALDLVNDDTGAVTSFDANLEYYSGIEDGESWSEGSRSTTEVLGSVPAGHYVLRLEGQHGGTGEVALHVEIHQGVFRWLWFWIGLVVLAVPFSLISMHAAVFHSRQWRNTNVDAMLNPKTAG